MIYATISAAAFGTVDRLGSCDTGFSKHDPTPHKIAVYAETVQRFDDLVQAALFSRQRPAEIDLASEITRRFRFNAYYADWQVSANLKSDTCKSRNS